MIVSGAGKLNRSWCHWTALSLVRVIGTKPSLKPLTAIFNWTLRWNWYQNSNHPIRMYFVVCKMSKILFKPQCVNLLGPSDAYKRHCTRPSLVQIMAYRLLGTKPLSKPMLAYCYHCEHISMKFYSNQSNFHSTKWFRKCRCKISAILFRYRCVCM